jgi:hypothetical protein
MPNIVDITPSCTSSCSLLGTAASLRDFLFNKNLPVAQYEVITAGLESQWYNKTADVKTYTNDEPKSLSDFGDIRSWTDPDEALIKLDTWTSKWILELKNNRYFPGSSYFSNTLTSHDDYVVYDVNNINITTNPYSIDNFISNYNQTDYDKINYYETFIALLNRYQPINNEGYIPTGGNTDYIDYGTNPDIIPTVINSTDDNIDNFTNPDGNDSPWDYTTDVTGARTFLQGKNKYDLGTTYISTNNSLKEYNNDSNNDIGIGLNNIDLFEVNTNELSPLGIIEGGVVTSRDITNYYCSYLNIYGGPGGISSDNDYSDWLTFVKNNTVTGCLPYINDVASPNTYGIQTIKNLGNLDLFSDYLPPQTSVILYKDG